jgi:hypothetical protein
MDKSDLLEEWDVVSVSAVYETEHGNTESNTENKEAEKENTKIDETENKSTENGSKIEEVETKDIVSDTKNDVDIMQANEGSSVDNAANTITVSADIEREGAAEHESKTLEELEGDSSEADNSEGDSEPCSQIESVRIIDPEPEKNMLEPEFETIIATEPESNIAASEPETTLSQCDINIQSNDNLITDLKAEVKSDFSTGVTADIDVKHNDDVTELNINEDSYVEDIVHVENPVNNNLDSSLTSEIGSDDFDIHDTPELLPERIQIEQEMASIESSSSDIDIIDENVEDSITSSYISPLSLSISSSVADASSIHSFITPSEDSQESKPRERIQVTAQERETKKCESTKKAGLTRDVPPRSENQRENSRGRRQESQRTSNRRSFFDWCFLLLELFRNVSAYDWCVIGSVAGALYIAVIVNQTNIFAVVQNDDVASQMKDMMNELKNDNKMLKEQMLSELKNKKAISSFEHQIRELRKENSKLSHMLYDVAKVLDKQKYSHEKKESEYLAPFKKEIDKLKEHINVLKFDNEELQKELVRTRYGGFAQQDSSTVEDQLGKKGSTRVEEDVSAEEIPEDFESLKKWNELITLLTKELGSLAGTEGFKNEKIHSNVKSEKSKPVFWKAIFTDFKGTINDLRKINFTTVFSNYKKANQKAMSDVYKFVKDFFSVADQTQQYTSDDSQWKNIGDFVSDLKEKWTNIKDRLYTSDLKQFFEKHFKNVADESPRAESSSQKTEDVDNRKPSAHSKSEKKRDQTETADEWMFKRAAHREELRNVPETEEDVNWYLKKNRHLSEDEKKERHF